MFFATKSHEALIPGLNLERILVEARKPLDLVEAYEFANNIPHNPQRRTFLGRTDLYNQLWAGVGRGIIELTKDKKMVLK